MALTSHSQRGRLGALTTNARFSGHAITEKARHTFRESFLDKVDPTGELRQTNPAEAQRRAEATRLLHYARMAYNSVMSRRLKRRLLASDNKKNAPAAINGEGVEREGDDGARTRAE